MKTQIVKITTVVVVSTILLSSTAFADTQVKSNGDLAAGFSFTDVFKKVFGEDTASDVPNVRMMKMEVATDSNPAGNISAQVAPATVLASTTEVAIEEEVVLNACEHFDNTVTNLLTLEAASSDTKQKLDNVEDTLDSESTLRDSILGSMKDLFGLQKKDKAVFKQMKKDITDARMYYSNLDKKTDSIGKFLDENSCEVVALAKAKKTDTDSTKLVNDEAEFRKTLVTGLKDKMKILQTSVQEAKK